MKILVVSKCPTHPTTAGNRWGILAQTKILEKLGNEIHFLYIQELPMKIDKKPFYVDLEETAKYWGDRFHCFKVSKFEKFIFNVRKEIDGVFFNNYYHIDEVYPYGLTQYVKKLHTKFHFDICIINYIYLTKLFTKVKFSKNAVFTHDCLAYKDLMVGQSCRTITAHQEAKALQRCQHIFAVQDEEMAYFHLLSPKSNVYNIYSKYDYHPQPIIGNKNILFLSGSNEYNVNGIRWFISDVLPMIRNRFKDAQLLIGGSICKQLTSFNHTEGIKLYGYVDSPSEFYMQGDIAINPVYQGTGLKIKTFEAISYDKITMVHPHSMAGVFQKDKAPIFAFTAAEEWVSFLDKVWANQDEIVHVKSRNKSYIEEMNEFILCEYKRFLNY